ncbi:MAG: glycosyltransferase family 2 protein [Bacteroidaceae bacterium]
MQDYGKVSIIMPTWNCAQYIGTTIKSVLNQTYTNWEILIQDDCSTDNTREVIEQLRVAIRQAQEPILELRDKISYACNERKSGAAITRNNALKRADGKWIAFLDSDDLWSSEKLALQVKFMEKNNYHFTYTNYTQIDKNGRENGILITGPKKITKLGMYLYCWPGCLTVMYDSTVIGLVQINDIRKNNDYAIWLKVIKKTNCYLLQEDLAQYRIHKDSISHHCYFSLIKWHYKLFHEAENMNIFSSIIMTCINLLFGTLKRILYVKHAA